MRTLVYAGVALVALGASLSPASAGGPVYNPFYVLGKTIAACADGYSYVNQCADNAVGHDHHYNNGGGSLNNNTQHITQDAIFIGIHVKPSRKIVQIGVNKQDNGSGATQSITQQAGYLEIGKSYHEPLGVLQVGVNENHGGDGNTQTIDQSATVVVINGGGGYGGGGCGGGGGGAGQGYCGDIE
jgi:hypothetical protein